MIQPNHTTLSIHLQCSLLSLSRSTYYYQGVPENLLNLLLMKLIDQQYMRTPFYGIRRMTQWLKDHYAQLGPINHKRIASLMKKMGLQGIYPRRNRHLSKPASDHQVFPYLLKDLCITRPNQVWAVDITFIPLQKGFAYLVAIIDWFSRYILAWQLSVTLEAEFCIEALQKALQQYQMPEFFNSDQGSQFTCQSFIQLLSNKGIRISMDGKGRVYDNIFIERFWRTLKYEEVYLHAYDSVREARKSIDRYIRFYNKERYHSALGYQTPEYWYQEKKDYNDVNKEGGILSL